MLSQQNVFFASANTTEGFISFFHKIFDPDQLSGIYILKGGPGTGKSSLMRSLSNKAMEQGLDVEEFLCSSDPNSLDGILIPAKNVAILDGTSPHTTDPAYPGVVENIVNIGHFWDKEKLLQDKGEILSLIQEKNRAYRRAYQFLRASAEIHRELAQLGERLLLTDKMNSSALRIAGRLFRKDGESRQYVRLLSSYNHTGLSSLNSFTERAKSVYVIEDTLLCSGLFLEQIRKYANEKKQNYLWSESPILPGRLDGLYFPDAECAFVVGKREYEKELPRKEYRYINMERFIPKDRLREHRQKIRFGKKCTDMMERGAQDSFIQAKASHMKLEKTYIKAMNFQNLDLLFEEIANEILMG